MSELQTNEQTTEIDAAQAHINAPEVPLIDRVTILEGDVSDLKARLDALSNRYFAGNA